MADHANHMTGIKYTLEQTIMRDKKKKARSRKRGETKAMKSLLGLLPRKKKRRVQ